MLHWAFKPTVKRPFSKVTCIINWKCLFVPFSDCFSFFHPLCGGILPFLLREDKFKMSVEVFAWKGFDFALSYCVMTHMLVEKWGDRIAEQKYSSSIDFSGWREKGFCLLSVFFFLALRLTAVFVSFRLMYHWWSCCGGLCCLSFFFRPMIVTCIIACLCLLLVV